MLPFCRVDRDDCRSLGAEVSYGCMDCGHNALCFRVSFVWWTFIAGIEFGG
jgi:hypothetical protein